MLVVLSPRLSTLDGDASSPHRHDQKNVGACGLQCHLQTSPPILLNAYPKFRNPRTTFENPPLDALIVIPTRRKGSLHTDYCKNKTKLALEKDSKADRKFKKIL